MKYGPLKEIWLASYAPFYAFIVFRHRTDAQDAASGADGETIAGRRIRVSHARPRTVGPRDRFIPDKYARERDDYSRGRDTIEGTTTEEIQTGGTRTEGTIIGRIATIRGQGTNKSFVGQYVRFAHVCEKLNITLVCIDYRSMLHLM